MHVPPGDQSCWVNAMEIPSTSKKKEKRKDNIVIDCDTMEDSTEDEQTKDDFIKKELEEEYSLDVFADDLIEGNQM